MSQTSLFDLLPKARPACHDCGRGLAEKDLLLPHTCERSLLCVGCCQDCHGAALERMCARILAGAKPADYWTDDFRSRKNRSARGAA